MLRSDAQEQRTGHVIVDSINISVIAEVEKELIDNPYDLISLVFLLYDVPATALQRLIVYQRVSRDVQYNNMNLLLDWCRHAQSKSNWKHEFMEALLLCQLYGIIRKLGFHVSALRTQYEPDSLSTKVYINPHKKVLYKLCESMNSANFMRLKKALLSYQIDAMEYEACELVLLYLMCEKFITINQVHYDKKVIDYEIEVENLAKILENLPDLQTYAETLMSLQNATKNDQTNSIQPKARSFKEDVSNVVKETSTVHNTDGFDEVYEMLKNVQIEESKSNFKSDTNKLSVYDYQIKNVSRVGICVIINQEDFYPSKESIKQYGKTYLERRLGSSKDERILEKTMHSLNFEVMTKSNIGHKEVYEFLKDIVRNHVRHDDSIFMLCLLSHGVRGHVYAADSMKVKIEDIQKFLDSDEAQCLHGMPKVLIIQACQVDDTPQPTLVADSPKGNNYLPKTDFLIYWATAPEFEAFRVEDKGSIFIHFLCKAIALNSKKEHLEDIFKKVNNDVTNLCTKFERVQVPLFESTLRKKLYLRIPE